MFIFFWGHWLCQWRWLIGIRGLITAIVAWINYPRWQYLLCSKHTEQTTSTAALKYRQLICGFHNYYLVTIARWGGLLQSKSSTNRFLSNNWTRGLTALLFCQNAPLRQAAFKGNWLLAKYERLSLISPAVKCKLWVNKMEKLQVIRSIWTKFKYENTDTNTNKYKVQKTE